MCELMAFRHENCQAMLEIDEKAEKRCRRPALPLTAAVTHRRQGMI
jgi:hypothetical protein